MFEEELNELLNSKTQADSLLKHLNDPIFEVELILFTKKVFKKLNFFDWYYECAKTIIFIFI